MNENMDEKEPRTESQAGATLGANHVFNVFQCFDHLAARQDYGIFTER